MSTYKERVLNGKKTAAMLKARDPDYYPKIGRLGGSAPKTKPSGFATNKKLASIVGKKGGLAAGYKRRMRNV